MASTTPPVAVVCVGMAGSGKTTFMQRLNAHLHTSKPSAPPYVLNLDPAVRSVPFESNIDIRDSVNYKEVMKQYNLGPNGGILTSLNLFSTKIDQVMNILEKRCLPSQEQAQAQAQPQPAHILIDTPGQIEVFVWSASGSILLSALASSFPTVIAYIIDTPRTTQNTSTFMSNMLYAVSILYKTKLPMVLVFNKTDVQSEEEAVEWMRDFESFQNALKKEEEAEVEGGGYMGSLINSMSLVLEEFYNHLSVVGVSSMTGDGIDGFLAAVEGKKEEFLRDYKPELERRRKEAEEVKKKVRDKEVERMMKDMNVSSSFAKGKGKSKGAAAKRKEEPETVSEAEEMDEDEDDEYSGLVDPDDDPSDDDPDGDEQGLKDRYAQALKGAGDGSATGFGKAADYIRRSQR